MQICPEATYDSSRGKCKYPQGCKHPCFPGNAKVKLENGKSVIMADLQIGDKVQTGKIRNSTLYPTTHTELRDN